MPTRNILSEVGPRLEALVIDLMEQGADQHAILYVIEKELVRLRERSLWRSKSGKIEEPSNWPSAG
ncbi:hypothetical protein FHX15_006116 [Rhizobium sp. BK650]|nr:hypothetical protein [Rhizobium sp. BK650]